LTSVDKGFIISKSKFYNGLSNNNQKYFEHRVHCFIDSHQFISRDGVHITRELKLLIAATAIQLTFGYRSYLYSRLDTIIIYPEDYFSPFGNQQHKGETNPKYKTVVLSWKDFKEGIENSNDNLDLGLHEFTHAMHFSFLTERTSSARYFLKHYKLLLNFMEDSKEQKKMIESGYLRAYAFENQYEFLAVLVEHFFETPTKFKSKLPVVYSHVKKILNQ